MWYVYCRYIKTGKENFVDCYETAEQAIERIARNYSTDKILGVLGEYYYFMKWR